MAIRVMASARANGRKLCLCAGLIVIPVVIVFLPLGMLSVVAVSAQATAPQTTTASAPPSTSVPVPQNTPEMTSHEATATFKVDVRLVQVHVVVRDSHGNAIGTLHKENFQLFDDGKPQVITKFDVEKSGRQIAGQQNTSPPATSAQITSAPPPDVPERYIAYLFDDVHLAFSDLAQVRQAAQKNLGTLQPTDRAAIFTTSGQGNLDFTDDRNKLNEALLRLMPHPTAGSEVAPCPKMTYYIADRMVNLGDGQAAVAMTADALACTFDNDPTFQKSAAAVAIGAASDALAHGNTETHIALSSIKDVVRRLSLAPGKRSIVLVSPGFITPEQHSDVNDIIERALNANVTISALDGRGLYALVPGGDASEAGVVNPTTVALEGQYQRDSASADADVMLEFADGTGGTFFQNSNDLAEGFRRAVSVPEYSYVLGFSPQNLKLNGHLHKLKVTLNTAEKFSVQARRGYFAPNHPLDRSQEAKQEIEEALFSREEMHELPVDLHTQFFKPSDTQAKLTVLAHIDVRPLHFKKADGRSNNNLTIVSGIFDRDGNYVTGAEKILELHLKDDTLANKLGSGLDVRSSFDVRPGGYAVRLVVRDEDGQIAAANDTVQIP
jgi:VWFA-related protein